MVQLKLAGQLVRRPAEALALLLFVAAVVAPPAVSEPFAQRASYLVVTNGGRIETVDAGGRVVRILGGVLPTATRAAWYVSRSRVIWLAPDGLTVARGDGTHRRLVWPWRLVCTARLSRTVGCPAAPTFAPAPKGTRVLIGAAGRSGDHLIVLSLTTGRLRDIAPVRASTRYYAEAWSPNGKSVAYSTNVWHSGPGRLFLARSDGSRPRALPLTGSVAWAPNSRLVAVMPEDGPPAIIDSWTGKVVRLRGVHPTSALPAWSSDSRRLAFAQSDGPLVVVSGAGGRIVHLRARGYAVAPSGRDLLVLSKGKSTRVNLVRSWSRAAPRTLFRLGGRQQILSIQRL